MALTPTVSVPAGSTSLLVRVPTVNDLVSEPTETVSLSAATAQNTTPVAGTGSILDNDGSPTLSITGPATIDEAAGTVTYTVTLSNPSATPVTVAYGPPMARPPQAATTPPPAVR
ncbi:MAG: hypothetical protein IPL70_12315 [Uliginosibacterium sp.]|nr:hypothetical protein [Uliginosibacterium sp.]